LFRYLIIVLPFLFVGCAHKPIDAFATADQCPSKLPTDEQFRAMSYPDFYRWNKLALEASDLLANATVLGKTIDPCAVQLASKHYELDRMMKYR
jgi:hypothetical protein